MYSLLKASKASASVIGPDHCRLAVDVGEGDDLAHVRDRIAATFEQACVVLHRQRRQGEEALEHMRIAGVPPLRDQRLQMVGFLDVQVSRVRADMAGDESLLVIDAEPVRKRLERQRMAGGARRHRIAVGLEGDPELAVGLHREDPTDVERAGIDRLQMDALLGPEVGRPALGAAVQAHVGDRLQPKVSGMMRGDFANLSERKLMDCLNRLGYDIEIRVRPAGEPIGHLTLATA